MSTPMIPLGTMAVYLVVVKYGPVFMKDRPAFNLRWVLFFYNFGLVILSAYMVHEFLMTAVEAGYSLQCEVLDFSYNPSALRILNVTWVYYVSKYIEVADTVFFILRKKTGQITVLHVWHHASIIFFWWFGTAYTPGGQAFFNPLLNCGVHVVMYTYYGLAALGPSLQPYLWWKKYLTKLQIIQFVIIAIHCIYSLIIECPYPKIFAIMALSYAIILILLFANFYRKTYNRQRPMNSQGKEPAYRNGVASHKQHTE
nr:hypothetical protein BaRGS_020453 [Batillaria attramentaria]